MPDLFEEESELAKKALYDHEAFAELYDCYFPRVYNFIFGRVMNRDVADDLISEVFERIFVKIGTYNPERGKLSTWIFTIASNIVADHFRKQIKCRQQPVDGLQELPSAQPGIEELLILEENKRCLFESLSRLTDRERNIIGLKFWARLTNREIARLTGESENNVAVILYRAVRRLKDLMKNLSEDI